MLTDVDYRKAICPTGKKRHRINDGGGLYLEVSPSGSKRWFWKFYPDGKESRLALGSYPEVTLKKAREARDEARKTHRAGVNPVQRRKVNKLAEAVNQATTFEAVAREYFAIKAVPDGWSTVHATNWLRGLEKDIFPWLGSLPVAEVSAPILLDALRKVESRGAVRTAHDLREFSGQVFRHAIATGRCTRNPAVDLRGALKPYTEKHMAALVEPAQAGELLRALLGYKGNPTTRAALLLSALVFQRPGNVRAMEWAEIDLEKASWSIPSVKMKRTAKEKANGRPHLVPLARQAVDVLKDLHPLTGHGIYVFPSIRTGERPMSENTIRGALRGMGYTNEDMTPHGFRAMARTIMVEHLGVDAEVLEAQLAHGKSGPLGMAYDRAEFVAQRRKMMQQWADYLDTLRDGAKVLPFIAA